MRRITLATLALLAVAPAARAQDAAQDLSGRYARHFTNGDVEGHAYGSDDVVEIVPVGQGAAYLRIELAFFNGHSCSLSGVGTARNQGIVYESSEFAMPGAPPCTLTVSHRDASLRIDDDGGSCKAYCGERGSLSNETLPFASRRPIGYMARLTSSQEFTDALKAWKERLGSPSAAPSNGPSGPLEPSGSSAQTRKGP